MIEVSYAGKDPKNFHQDFKNNINEGDFPPDMPFAPDYPPEQQPSQQPQFPPDPLKEYGQPFGFGQGFGMPAPPAKNPRGSIYFLTIIGQIEGHTTLPPFNKTTKYEHVIPQLVMTADSPEIDGMMILLNTVGGDVEAGLAIAELISKLGKPTVSLVIGGGHSIGVPLAVSADFSFIAPSATMTVHPVRLNGTVVGAPQTYDYFNKMQDRVIDFITANSKITSERLSELMLDTNKLALDMGTILIGEEAVNERLIDATGGLYDALEKLYEMIEREKDTQNDTKSNSGRVYETSGTSSDVKKGDET